MTRHLVSALSLVLGLAAVLAVGSLGSAQALATMTVTTRDDPTLPQLVSTSLARPTDVDVAADGATGVTVTFSGDGLSIDTPVVALGTVTGSARASVEVTATSGGFHTLNVQVTSSNSAPVSTSLPLMWSPGGAPIAATGDLTGRNYGNIDFYSANGTSDEDRQLLTFLDDETAFIGLPAKGKPVCSTVSDKERKGCVRYRYDEATGIVTLGGAIGKVIGKTIYANGIGHPDDQDGGEAFNERIFSQRVGYPAPGKRYGASWRWTYDNYPTGLQSAKLTLRKNGTFELRFSYDSDPVKVRKGSYALTAPGRLRLHGAFGTELHTLAVRAKSNGKADPALGVWLTFGKGSNVDGALLKYVG